MVYLNSVGNAPKLKNKGAKFSSNDQLCKVATYLRSDKALNVGDTAPLVSILHQIGPLQLYTDNLDVSFSLSYHTPSLTKNCFISSFQLQFLYVRQSFAPSLDEKIGVLAQAFGSEGKHGRELVINYALTSAWG